MDIKPDLKTLQAAKRKQLALKLTVLKQHNLTGYFDYSMMEDFRNWLAANYNKDISVKHKSIMTVNRYGTIWKILGDEWN